MVWGALKAAKRKSGASKLLIYWSGRQDSRPAKSDNYRSEKNRRNQWFLSLRPLFDSSLGHSQGHNLGHNCVLGRCVFRADIKPIAFEVFDMARKAPLDRHMVPALARRETIADIARAGIFRSICP
jgi:hypothetical protein